jgi:hypothetical protein
MAEKPNRQQEDSGRRRPSSPRPDRRSLTRYSQSTYCGTNRDARRTCGVPFGACAVSRPNIASFTCTAGQIAPSTLLARTRARAHTTEAHALCQPPNETLGMKTRRGAVAVARASATVCTTGVPRGPLRAGATTTGASASACPSALATTRWAAGATMICPFRRRRSNAGSKSCCVRWRDPTRRALARARRPQGSADCEASASRYQPEYSS